MSDENDLKKLSVRELRARAAKSLGSKVAAGLKLKQELVDALVAGASKVLKKAAPAAKKPPPKAEPAAKKAEPVVKKAEPAAKKAEPVVKKAEPVAKKAEPAKRKAEPEKVKAETAKKAEPEKKAEPAKKSPPRKRAATPPRPSALERTELAPAASPSPPIAAKPSKSEKLAQVYELPITRDFFVDPRRQALPASYGDDRLLCFRREPLAIMVSWDLSTNTFADGQGVQLELVTGKGRLVGSVTIGSATGLATFDALPKGQALTVQVVRQGRVMTRGRPFMIGGPAEEAGELSAGAGAWQMTVPIDQPLPKTPEKREWADAPARTEWKQTRTVALGSSRTGPVVEEGASERGGKAGARRRASSSRISS